MWRPFISPLIYDEEIRTDALRVTEVLWVAIFFILGFGLTIVITAICKAAKLRKLGAEGIATSLGGTRITASTYNLTEKQFYEPVKGMALASGVSTPNVYIFRTVREFQF